jgi:hypothetical protein
VEAVCLVLVGLMLLVAAVVVVFELVGDAVEGVFDLIGPIGALLVLLVLIGVCLSAL